MTCVNVANLTDEGLVKPAKECAIVIFGAGDLTRRLLIPAPTTWRAVTYSLKICYRWRGSCADVATIFAPKCVGIFKSLQRFQ